MVIFVAGLVGVGKSSIARRLADRLSIHYYAVDDVKKVIYPQDPDKDHILKDPLKMYRSFEKEFESFDESHIVCDNNGSLEEATESLLSLIKNLAALGGTNNVLSSF